MTQDKSTTIRKLSIQDFKGFFTEQSLEFAQPNGSLGSGLTIIAGPNNSGKTTIIEALALKHNDSISQNQRHGCQKPIIKMTLEVDDKLNEVTMSTIDDGSKVSSTLKSNNKPLFENVSVRRHWNSVVLKQKNLTYAVMKHQANKSIERKELADQLSINFATTLSDINQNVTQKQQLTELLKLLITNFHFWTVDTSDDEVDYIKYTTNNNVSHRIEFLGNGVITLFRICTALLEDKDNRSILIIDEPELSLHPA